MNLRDIDVFNAIMITRGAGAAAALLDTSQPAISRSLAKLEAELGFRLFDRIRGRLVPTREGELFHTEVKANLVGLDRLKLRAAQIKEVGTGTVRVASLSALGHGLVPRAIAAFSRRHPHVRISYQVRTSNIVRDLVASGSFDIGLAADEVDTSGVLHSIFNTPRAVCVMPKNHRLARKATITPADLADEAFLALSPEDTVRLAMDKILAAHGVRPRILIETPYGLTIAILAAKGLGIGLVNPSVIADRMIGGIAARPFEPAVHFRALLLRPPDGINSTLVTDFIAELYVARNALSSEP
ncbi:LysR family transcriptional regulator [Mesorhizobium sp. M1C.F.Ca.ET.193.01.1.1]|uniref:LysR family transcriptional regulator n=1 Tax=unclassified Mesorhizobium TaxID=325217 RepID=UPI000FD1FE6D|nr:MULTISPECIES: LysR family transcriptional regulator [unclassified Mesorhizobium]TGT01335.1 LysR family transcriptional regulator [bacterium M00.F.Ca.ET.177.01.1.1]TGQ54098.1 LysR family transcriptional regulator [Mesorhizobium sp. M1C.F.Ca.ET.210.01.1.1]TGQ72112.1 LysR family transcriptional regulator [Mesorhizobium sp. M1C.F.Ca.ET.212.01.1.1]TGR09927.1 LysR family transcriptional regulator [Mesorhizobium sp. M1C.F.Ca.ET.204.01.1.1]TGR30047.1 LysR family transcriptional regulator [Mesorhizo